MTENSVAIDATEDDEFVPECIARTTQAGWHDDGDEELDVVLYSKGKGGGVLERMGPYCRRHAEYEVAWRKAANMAHLARIKPHQRPSVAPD